MGIVFIKKIICLFYRNIENCVQNRNSEKWIQKHKSNRFKIKL